MHAEEYRYDISECHLKPGAGLVREAFAYVDPGTCNTSIRPHLPPPRLDLPCDQPCEPDHYLKVTTVYNHGKKRGVKGQLDAVCTRCAPGRFSLGGGRHLDGSLGDWARTWPEGLSTSCLYREADSRWTVGGGARLACVLHLEHAGQAEGLSAETRAGTWNRNLPDVALQVPFHTIDGLACDPISGDSAIDGAAVLVLRGTCPFSTKTQHLEAAGAKAVIVYNNLFHRPHFIPAAAPNSSAAGIPIYMVTREDGERMVTLASDAAAEGESLYFRIPSTRCSLDRREAAPTTNRSGEVLTNADSWEASQKGCSLWAADPAGSFLHSGDNRGFHWIFSYLTYSVRFVRDGYIRFRYAVDAEMGYDGLVFEIDGEPVFNGSLRSQVAPWQDVRFPVSRGSRSFTWTYKKDFGTTAGEDRARLQLLEVSGTAHGDLTCRSCSVLSSPGSGHCQTCGRDQYSEVQVDRILCRKCPRGSWAPAGSVGSDSCQVRRTCTVQDAQIVYRAWNSSKAAASDSVFCRGNKTMVHAVWRQPMTCQTTLSANAMVGITTNNRVRQCPPCQPFRWRPNGGTCVNRPARTCPAPKFALPVLKVNRWEVFPENFTSWIWGRPSVEDQSHSWQLAPDGSAVEVGTAFLGGGGAEAEALLSARADQALLTLDVSLANPGRMKFTLEEKPAGAWSAAGALYVDHEPQQPEVVLLDGRLHFSLRMEPGWHWVTWVWRYTGPKLEEQAADTSLQQEGSGLRLLNVSVTNVVGASQAGPCQTCPPGRGLVNSTVCHPCPPGWSTAMDGGEPVQEGCSRCPAGRASSGNRGRGSATCTPCGPGTFSDPGASFCKPLVTLGGAGRLQWSSQSILTAWNSSQVNGLRAIEVEDRTYYMSLLEPKQFPGVSQQFAAAAAYVWEVLPPRASSEGDACDATVSSPSALRPFAETLREIKPNEGKPPGLWLNFVGQCEPLDQMGQRTRRELHILLSCDPDARRDNLDMKLLSAMRPQTPGGCEDLALEWSTPLACPQCQEGDWEMTVPHQCDSVKGQRVSYVAPSGCRGGIPKPPDFWRPCPGVVNILAFVAMGAFVGCILCCLSCYVLLLRRRYSRYMVLEEPHANGVAPSSIGVPDSPQV
ncbi:ELAPOR2 [Symbiodinium natans]|uniref:ELAPOR2 protein n=1 Tax=Symbiodinium natans TaxID=878477 RepID=A0A812GTS4_9DINO|nr:ELAPOR2 [Symbiodinium natans]